MGYFEMPRPRGYRHMGYVGAYRLHDKERWAAVINRASERWNEVELNQDLPLSLHDSLWFGADMCRTCTDDGSEIISGDGWRVQVFISKRWERFGKGWSFRKMPLNPDQILDVVCHYKTPDHRNTAIEWLEKEQEYAKNGRNSYQSVIDYCNTDVVA